MRHAAATVLVTAAAVFAPGAAAATGLSVSPLRLTLTGAAETTITVRNPGAHPLLVAVSRAGFSRTLHGRPRVQARQGAADWLHVRPRQLRLAPHATGTLRVVAAPPSGASPGDHPALVLLGTRQPRERRLRVLVRIGVIVVLHVPGAVVRRLEPQAITARRRGSRWLLALRLANRGNVVERVGGARTTLELSGHGGRGATLRSPRQELLPHSSGVAEFVYRGRLRGPVTARVMGRSFRLRL